MKSKKTIADFAKTKEAAAAAAKNWNDATAKAGTLSLVLARHLFTISENWEKWKEEAKPDGAEKAPPFGVWALREFKIDKSYVSLLTGAGKVLAVLDAKRAKSPKLKLAEPTSEGQIRSLRNLTDEDMVTVWKNVTEGGKQPTANEVAEAAKPYTPTKEPKQSSASSQSDAKQQTADTQNSAANQSAEDAVAVIKITAEETVDSFLHDVEKMLLDRFCVKGDMACQQNIARLVMEMASKVVYSNPLPSPTALIDLRAAA